MSPHHVKRYRQGVAQTEDVITEFNSSYNTRNP